MVLIVLPDHISRNPTMYFPLGVCYLASVVRKAGYAVEVMDFRQKISRIPKARFYGFSVTTPQIKTAKVIAKTVPGITIVGGGHPSLFPQDCEGSFDYVVAGEGEQVIVPILEGKIERGLTRTPRINNLDSIPFPAWDMVMNPFSDALFPGERYGKAEPAAPLIGSRGCPFKCSYCGNVHRNPVTYRSAGNILEELNQLMYIHQIRYFRFEDDNFTLLPDFDKLCKEMAELEIHYKCATRADLLTIERAEMMRYSGCEECAIGVESADPRVLNRNRKKETPEDYVRAITVLKKVGLRAKVYFMAGLPGEDDATLHYNMEFMKRTKPDKWTLSTFSPYPGCDVYARPETYGVEIINHDWHNYANFCQGKFNHVIKGQTQEQMWKRYRKFYEWLKGESWKRA